MILSGFAVFFMQTGFLFLVKMDKRDILRLEDFLVAVDHGIIMIAAVLCLLKIEI